MEQKRAEYETHWQMNSVTRAVFDRVGDAASASLPQAGEEGRTVLDIGCGGQSNIVFPNADRVVGVDIDEAGLDRNTTITEKLLVSVNDLDLRAYPADAIACIFTLEHVEEPDVVLGKLARALKPGGVMVIAVPQVGSIKALVTRYTPHSFHKWFYKRILGRDPRPTEFRLKRSLTRPSHRNGCTPRQGLRDDRPRRGGVRGQQATPVPRRELGSRAGDGRQYER